MHNFEYKRGLGHVWYLHPLFWGITLVQYSLTLVFNWSVIPLSEPMMMLNLAQVIGTLLLCVIGYYYPYDVLYARRTYVKVKELNSSGDLSSSLIYKSPESMSSSLHSDKIKFKKFPIIYAKVTSSMSVENGKILYEIVTRTKKDELHINVKRSLDDFINLD
jgi:hypothetical protein